jgi:hypothetical protein
MAFSVKQILYECASATCTPDTRKKKIRRGDIVLMIAKNIDAKIVFTSGSPFVSGKTTISIPKGTIAAEFVATGAAKKSFPYTLTCKNPFCAARSDPPEMIVEG